MEYELLGREEVGYWRLMEEKDVELALAAQRGFENNVLGWGSLYSMQDESGFLSVSFDFCL